jgi:hypothetical protein
MVMASEVTVAELIRFLENQDPDMPVRTYCYEFGQHEEILEYYVDRDAGVIVIQ